ncbi:MAG: apolipoprotein N-acyltransferase [Caldilineaceae bacterium]|nr:apolipoprotein N-acyltransferase [Caldilineaceae bacterium]
MVDMSPWAARSLAFAFGTCGVLGFAPLAWYGIILFALAGLFWLWFGRSWRDAPMIGLAFGLGWFGAGIHWVWYSAYAFGGTPLPLAIVINVLLVCVLALYPAAYGWLGKRYLAHGTGPLVPIAAAALWVLIESLREVLFTGFPWLNPGYAFVGTSLVGYAPIGGVNMVAMIVVLTAALLVQAGLRRISAWWVLLPVGLWLGGVVLVNITWVQATGTSLNVAIIQGNIDQAAKWRPEQRRQIIEQYVQMSERHIDADLIVWPETALPVFFDRAEPLLRGLDKDARSRGAGILVGAPTRIEDGRYFNSLVAMGAATGDYQKRHLVPFGEYVPLSGLFGKLIQFLDVPMSSFSRGEWLQTPIRLGEGAIAVTICFEDAFPTESHSYAADTNLMVNVSNDAWFGATWAPDQHLQIARMRAAEAQQYLVRATNTGLSAVVGPYGDIIDIGRPWEPTVVRTNVRLMIGETPFRRIGGLFWEVVFLLVAVSSAVIFRLR